jgi:hypothetical protein
VPHDGGRQMISAEQAATAYLQLIFYFNPFKLIVAPVMIDDVGDLVNIESNDKGGPQLIHGNGFPEKITHFQRFCLFLDVFRAGKPGKPKCHLTDTHDMVHI